MTKLKFAGIAASVFFMIAALPAEAQRRGGGGGHSVSFGLSLVTADQKDLNSIGDAIGNTYPGAFGMKSLGSAYEFFGQYQYRFSGSMFAMIFRPSYFMQSTSGSCGGASCDIKLSGLALFPMLRIVPLENSFIKFFMQGGVGFGSLTTSISEGAAAASAKFSGSAYGGQAGIGADFCFTPSHCLTIEGNIRYLPVERNTYDSQSGTFTGGFSNSGSSEVERNNSDVSTTMSGIQGVIAYTLNF